MAKLSLGEVGGALEMIRSADVAEIDAKVDELSGEINRISGEVKVLKRLRALIETAQHGPKPRQPRKPKGSRAPEKRPPALTAERIRTYLTASGPTSASSLARALECNLHDLLELLRKSHFRERGGQWSV